MEVILDKISDQACHLYTANMGPLDLYHQVRTDEVACSIKRWNKPLLAPFSKTAL
ncbi:MAG: hypothetical protein Q8O18_01600 [Deltaproteobacteria bacterium]|nr:hypothetical protein [Deltaproteobacteria bacterium]